MDSHTIHTHGTVSVEVGAYLPIGFPAEGSAVVEALYVSYSYFDIKVSVFGEVHREKVSTGLGLRLHVRRNGGAWEEGVRGPMPRNGIFTPRTGRTGNEITISGSLFDPDLGSLELKVDLAAAREELVVATVYDYSPDYYLGDLTSMSGAP
jgi:hypothetical protein